MEWDEQTIAQIREMWAEGLSTAEIGRRMGITKNAVVGKAHRLSLPPRPSPIRRVAGDARIEEVQADSLQIGASLSLKRDTVVGAPVPETAPSRVLPRPPVQLRAVAPQPRPPGRVSTCCWPLGDPGTPSFRFCSDAAMQGKPYCGQHAALAYVKVRDRREDAA